jgi:hypothetical protein
MAFNTKLMLGGILAIGAAFPFVTIGVLAVIARLRKVNLRPTLPWLRTMRWVGWLVGITVASVAFVSHGLFPTFWFFIGISIVSASAGLAISEQWVKRRDAPESLLPHSPSNPAA